MSDLNIYQRMARITEELQTVAKNLTVDTGKGRGYKAVSERDIIDAVKPLEAKHGVYSYPLCRETVASEILVNEYGKNVFYCRIKTIYRFVNTEKPEDYIDTEVFSVGIDSQDKGDGKAMTYGDKYALMKAYKISTGDDPDQEASREESYSTARQAPRTVSDEPIKNRSDVTKPITDKQLAKLHAEIKRTGNTVKAIEEYKGKHLADLTRAEASSVIRTLEARPDMPPRAPEDPQIDMSVAEADELPFK